MAWIIDKDLLAEEENRYREQRAAEVVANGGEYAPEPPLKPGTNDNAVGIIGPRSYKGDGTELSKRFRILDDDGEVYYEGRCDTDNDDNALGPLDDFGTPNAGATIIQYWVSGKGGGWRNLN